MGESPTTVLRKVYEVMNTRSLDELDHLYHPTFTFNGETSSPAEVKGYCGAYLAAFGDLELTVERIVADGEWVAGRVVARGTHTGQLGDMPATGRKVEIGQHDLARIVDGRIVDCWTVFDQYGMLEQLGALPGSDS